MPISESVKAKVIETINDMKDLSIKKMEGKAKVYIFAQTDGQRGDARKKLSDALKKKRIAITVGLFTLYFFVTFTDIIYTKHKHRGKVGGPLM